MKIDLYKSFSGRSPVEDFITGLSKEDQALFKTIHDGIERDGLKYPYVIFKPIEGKLWEIKFKGLDGSYRTAYVLVTGPKMYWLHVFKKKTQKISRLDFELAWKRMKEISAYEKDT